VHTVFRKAQSAGIPFDGSGAFRSRDSNTVCVSLDAQGNLTRTRSKLWNDARRRKNANSSRRRGRPGSHDREVETANGTGYTAAKNISHAAARTRGLPKDGHVLPCAQFYQLVSHRRQDRRRAHHGARRHIRSRALESQDRSMSDKTVRAIDPSLSANFPRFNPPTRASGRFEGTGSNVRLSGRLQGRRGKRRQHVRCGRNGERRSRNRYSQSRHERHGVHLPSGTICGSDRRNFGIQGQHRASLPLLCVSNLANGYNDVLRIHGLTYDQFEKSSAPDPPRQRRQAAHTLVTSGNEHPIYLRPHRSISGSVWTILRSTSCAGLSSRVTS